MKTLKSIYYTVAGIGAMMLVSCAQPAPPAEEKPAIDMDALRTEIQAMEDAFSAGEKAKDADAVAAYYADDAISYSRDKEPSVGKEAIKAKIAENLANDTSGTSSVYKVVDLWAEGDMAVEIGSWTDVDTNGTETRKGYYMSYFQKRDGKWLCVRDMNVKVWAAKDEMAKAAE